MEILNLKKKLTKNILYRKYVIEKKSLPEIKNEYNLKSCTNIYKLLKLYGINSRSVKEACNNPQTIRKREKTSLKKYGYRSNFQSPKTKITIRKKYGVSNIFQVKEIVKSNMLKIRKINEKNGKWVPLDQISNFEKYKRKVESKTRKNYNKYFYKIKNAKKRSREWHLDHIVSKYYGFKNNIAPEIIGHYKNLRIVHHSINESKGFKCPKNAKMLIKEISGEI